MNNAIQLSLKPGIPHGADYYPEQWLHDPEVLKCDIDLMLEAGMTTITMGVFAWSMLEPEEGRFEFGWLHERLESLHTAGIRVILASPSGAPPRWLTHRYPEILRVAPDDRRNPPGRRLNFCPCSEKYRELVGIIINRLAGEMGQHPALALWHVNNELAWPSYSEAAKKRFREYLQERFTSLDALNRAWNTPFWSARFSAWDQINPPALLDGMEHQKHEDIALPGLTLEWRRFTSWINADFLRHEISSIRQAGSSAPVTTNTWGLFGDFHPRDIKDLIDVVAVDSYPAYKGLPGEERLSSHSGFVYDAARSLKNGKPFLLAETSPGGTFGPVGMKLKRPHQLALNCLQAVAHGADAVMYFQWRQSVGGAEQFHPGVLSHTGKTDARMFSEIRNLGNELFHLAPVFGATTPAETALIFDRDIHWATLAVHGFHSSAMNYPATCEAHYDALRTLNVPMDVISCDAAFDSYRLLIAPMLFLLHPGVAEKLEAFVKKGGCLVATYLTGYVDEFNTSFTGGYPGPLKKLLGLEIEEMDVLVHGPAGSTGWDANLPIPDRPLIPNEIRMTSDNPLGLSGSYEAAPFCEIIRLTTAEPLAIYQREFYSGSPALSCNQFGDGNAYYIASANSSAFLEDFYRAVTGNLGVSSTWPFPLPPGVRVNRRSSGTSDFYFFQNYSPDEVEVSLPEGEFSAVPDGIVDGRHLRLPPYGVQVIEMP